MLELLKDYWFKLYEKKAEYFKDIPWLKMAFLFAEALSAIEQKQTQNFQNADNTLRLQVSAGIRARADSFTSFCEAVKYPRQYVLAELKTQEAKEYYE